MLQTAVAWNIAPVMDNNKSLRLQAAYITHSDTALYGVLRMLSLLVFAYYWSNDTTPG